MSPTYIDKFETACFDLVVANEAKFKNKEKIRMSEHYKRLQKLKKKQKVARMGELYRNVKSNLDIIDSILGQRRQLYPMMSHAVMPMGTQVS